MRTGRCVGVLGVDNKISSRRESGNACSRCGRLDYPLVVGVAGAFAELDLRLIDLSNIIQDITEHRTGVPPDEALRPQ